MNRLAIVALLIIIMSPSDDNPDQLARNGKFKRTLLLKPP